MHVKDVELVARHQIQRTQHRGLRVEVAADVEHEAPITETRRVHDVQRGQRHAPAPARRRSGQQPAQGLQSIEDTCRRCANDPDPGRRVDRQIICLRR